jgi:hypothetical protein
MKFLSLKILVKNGVSSSKERFNFKFILENSNAQKRNEF